MNFEKLTNEKGIKGIVFDMDGVISDTAELHLKSWEPIAKLLSSPMTKDIKDKLRGRPRKDALQLLINNANKKIKLSEKQKQELCDYKNDIYIQSLSTLNAKNILPGITDIIKFAKQHRIKIAVASSSKNVLLVLKNLGLINQFDYIADIRKIKNGKPAPDIFLDAVKGLGLSPSQCMGLEDASCGVEAINKAGMFSIGVGNKQTLYKANIVVNTLTAFDFNHNDVDKNIFINVFKLLYWMRIKNNKNSLANNIVKNKVVENNLNKIKM